MQTELNGQNQLAQLLEQMGLKDNKKKHQSHGLTVGEMEDLRTSSKKEVPANRNLDYKIPAHEQHLLHVSVENKFFDSKSGKKKSIPKIQTFYLEDFERMNKDRAFEGLDVVILHDPRRRVGSVSANVANLKSLSEDELRNIFFAETGSEASPDASIKQLISDIEDFRKKPKN